MEYTFVCKSHCQIKLSLLACVKHLIDQGHPEKEIHTFISFQNDCMLCGLFSLYCHASRQYKMEEKCDHIIPHHLRFLCFIIEFKVLMFVFQVISSYIFISITECCVPLVNFCPKTIVPTVGWSHCPVAAAEFWNALAINDLALLKSQHKTSLVPFLLCFIIIVIISSRSFSWDGGGDQCLQCSFLRDHSKRAMVQVLHMWQEAKSYFSPVKSGSNNVFFSAPLWNNTKLTHSLGGR